MDGMSPTQNRQNVDDVMASPMPKHIKTAANSSRWFVGRGPKGKRRDVPGKLGPDVAALARNINDALGPLHLRHSYNICLN